MPLLKIYNTISHQKEVFVPITKDRIGVYVCGPTVYGPIHLGNARVEVFFDVVVRYLRSVYPRVTYVRNVTDIDDKIIQAAEKRGISTQALVEETYHAFQEDIQALNCRKPDYEPFATDHVPQMIHLITVLLEKGHAYCQDGHVYFDTQSYRDYGVLWNITQDHLNHGSRIEVVDHKRDPSDFVLWKPSMDGEVFWESAWGNGRPGWHIECSAMSLKHLGSVFDIHGGGHDLIFPHHVNECAQSVCASGEQEYAKYWMHVGYLLSSGKKMSKSFNNFFTVQEILKKVQGRGEVVRLSLLLSHYRHPLNWNPQTLEQSSKILNSFYDIFLEEEREDLDKDLFWFEKIQEDYGKYQNPLREDFNTPFFITKMQEIVKKYHQSSCAEDKKYSQRLLWHLGKCIGIFESPLKKEIGRSMLLSPQEVEHLVAQREVLRQNKKFIEADEIRNHLLSQGISLQDTVQGVQWRYKS